MRSNNSPPSILEVEICHRCVSTWNMRMGNFGITTYNSKTQIILEPSSYASYNWIIRGWCKPLMISISRSIFRRSSLHVTLTYLAANRKFVAFSVHTNTVPNVPLFKSNDQNKVSFQWLKSVNNKKNATNSLGTSHSNDWRESAGGRKVIDAVMIYLPSSFFEMS